MWIDQLNGEDDDDDDDDETSPTHTHIAHTLHLNGQLANANKNINKNIFITFSCAHLLSYTCFCCCLPTTRDCTMCTSSQIFGMERCGRPSPSHQRCRHIHVTNDPLKMCPTLMAAASMIWFISLPKSNAANDSDRLFSVKTVKLIECARQWPNKFRFFFSLHFYRCDYDGDCRVTVISLPFHSFLLLRMIYALVADRERDVIIELPVD